MNLGAARHAHVRMAKQSTFERDCQCALSILTTTMSRLDFVTLSRLLIGPAVLVLALPWAVSYARNSQIQTDKSKSVVAPPSKRPAPPSVQNA